MLWLIFELWRHHHACCGWRGWHHGSVVLWLSRQKVDMNLLSQHLGVTAHTILLERDRSTPRQKQDKLHHREADGLPLRGQAGCERIAWAQLAKEEEKADPRPNRIWEKGTRKEVSIELAAFCLLDSPSSWPRMFIASCQKRFRRAPNDIELSLADRKMVNMLGQGYSDPGLSVI